MILYSSVETGFVAVCLSVCLSGWLSTLSKMTFKLCHVSACAVFLFIYPSVWWSVLCFSQPDNVSVSTPLSSWYKSPSEVTSVEFNHHLLSNTSILAALQLFTLVNTICLCSSSDAYEMKCLAATEQPQSISLVPTGETLFTITNSTHWVWDTSVYCFLEPECSSVKVRALWCGSSVTSCHIFLSSVIGLMSDQSSDTEATRWSFIWWAAADDGIVTVIAIVCECVKIDVLRVGNLGMTMPSLLTNIAHLTTRHPRSLQWWHN